METHSEIAGINRLDWIKRSPRSRRGQALADTFERVRFLRKMGIDTIEFPTVPVALIKTYAARVSRLKLTRVTRLRATTRDIGLPCFLLMSLWRTTDEAIDAWLMRVAEVRRLAMDRSADKAEIDWQRRHESLVTKVAELAAGAIDDLPTRLADLIAQEQAPRQSRAEHARQTLLGMSAHVRRLLRLMVALPIQCQQPDDWLTQAIGQLQQTYAKQQDRLDVSVTLTYLPPLWRRITPRNGGERLRLLEAATLLQLQRSLRNGHVVVLSSLSFRSRDALLIPLARWEERRSTYLKQLGTAGTLGDITKTVTAQMTAGLRTLAQAVRQERVVIDNEGIRAPQWTEVLADTGVEMRLRRAFAQHVGSVELPRLLMEVDSEVRFSAIVLQRSPRNDAELMTVYGAVLAHGMGLDREQVLRMIPTVTDSALHTAMAQLEDEGRLAQANTAIVQFMHRHPVVTAWGDPGLASSDMMTIEASRRLWNARVDPRSGNYAIGTYTHVLDQWGIAHDQPIVLNRRQAGAAIEGVLLQRLMPINQLAVDTHGYTDVAMGLARLLGFDLCPRLAHLRERKLYVPDGLYVPKPLRSITVGISLRTLREQWESLLRLAASTSASGSTTTSSSSATDALGRLGSDAQGDPLYQAAVSFGRLVRTQYLCKYFADAQFRGSIRRALNHGESVHQLQRTIQPYAIGPKRGRSREEQRAISGSLALLSNAVMAWNTQALQAMVNLPAHKRPDITSADLAASGPVATGHINFRGVLHFPVEELGAPILRVPVRLGAR